MQTSKMLEFSDDKPLFPISTAAKLLDISVHTLRMYEREGLFIPFKKKSSQRLFSKSDIERIECIRKAIKESKISINGIRAIYSLIPCWEIKHCAKKSRDKCPAYWEHTQPCWSYKHEGNDCENQKCRECNVYNDYTDCGKIKNLIKTLSGK